MRSSSGSVGHDAVDGAQRPIGVDGDVGDVVDVLFHRLRRAEAIERLDDEEGIAQPAVAIVPVALRAGRLGDRRRMGGDDGAGLLEVAELQGDGRADDLRLAFQRDRQGAHPVEPILAGALEELARVGRHGRFERLVRPQDQRDRLDQRERRLVRDVGKRRVRRQPQRVRAACIADVVGAQRPGRAGLSVVEGRANPDPDARQARRRLDAAEDLRRVEDALEALEARREVGDAHRIPGLVARGGLDDRGVAQVGRLVRDRSFQ